MHALFRECIFRSTMRGVFGTPTAFQTLYEWSTNLILSSGQWCGNILSRMHEQNKAFSKPQVFDFHNDHFVAQLNMVSLT